MVTRGGVWGVGAAVSVVSSAGPVEAQRTLDAEVPQGRLVLNLRAEGDPKALTSAVQQALTAMKGYQFTPLMLETFRPSPPTPTHRVK